MGNDGLMYNCVFGTVWIHQFQEWFNFPAKNHVNWIVRVTVGEDNDNGLVISGCRINYATRMDEPPPILLTNNVMMLGPNNMPFNFYYSNIYIVKD
jgi:hypothetical protein